MIKTRKNKEGRFQMYCDCGCGEGISLYYSRDSEDEEYPTAYLEMVTYHFYSEQETIAGHLFKKLKRIWYIIRNKEYCYF